jgi:hypothetical protein
MSATEPPARTAPIALWRAVQTFLHTLYNLFGAPEDVAAQGQLTTKARTEIQRWLRACEAALRRLLLIEAAALAVVSEPPASSRQGHRRKPRPRKLMTFEANKPEQWRVSFRCFAPALRQAQGPNTTRGLSPSKAGPTLHSPWPLAERYEALIRVFNAPHAYAKRLATRLRRAAQRLFLKPEPDAPNLIGEEEFADMDARAHEALRTINSS